MHTTSQMPSGSEQSAKSKGTVLVVEDDEMVCALLHEILEAYGYHAISSHNAEQAMSVVSGFCGSLDLLLTDIVLPKTSGCQLSKAATTLRPALKTLYMSGYPDSYLKKFGRTVVPYLQKPFGPGELIARIRRALSNTSDKIYSCEAANHVEFN